jgi:sortase A
VIAVLFRRVFAATALLLAAAALLTGAGALETLSPSLSFSETPPRLSAAPPLGRICPGDTIARIAVARLQYEAPVREGADAETLAHGPGHVPGTALPGEESGRKHALIAIARDAGAEIASQLVLGDLVLLRTPFGARTYRVVARRTVRAEDFRIDPTDGPTLTLVAPYPPDSVGPAPLRLAVRAEPVPTSGGLDSVAMRSATRSTGKSLTLAGVAVSWASRQGR